MIHSFFLFHQNVYSETAGNVDSLNAAPCRKDISYIEIHRPLVGIAAALPRRDPIVLKNMLVCIEVSLNLLSLLWFTPVEREFPHPPSR